ncbi:MAG TPA: glycerophosphodiester phosphodiesterase family protein [Actinobacteria bacterium]|nr:glycerophosphodiester phosphodiesterase family protein [Actinomycetota bacterium]
MKTSKAGGLIDLGDRERVQERHPLLIAHRGGVITPTTPENSLAAIRLAADRGYDMVELDIRRAKDGEPVMFHDWEGNLLTSCGVRVAVRDLTRDEISATRYVGTDEPIAMLEQGLALCRSLELGVMLDIKSLGDTQDSETFLKTIGRLLREHDLSGAVLAWGHPLERRHLADTAMFPVSDEDTHQAIGGRPVSLDGQYWLGPAQHLSVTALQALQRRGVLVFAAINTFLYPVRAHVEPARHDIERFLDVGIDGFQIDSVYEDFFGTLHAGG